MKLKLCFILLLFPVHIYSMSTQAEDSQSNASNEALTKESILAMPPHVQGHIFIRIVSSKFKDPSIFEKIDEIKKDIDACAYLLGRHNKEVNALRKEAIDGISVKYDLMSSTAYNYFKPTLSALLRAAAYMNKPIALMDMLLDYGADPNDTDVLYGEMALHHALDACQEIYVKSQINETAPLEDDNNAWSIEAVINRFFAEINTNLDDQASAHSA